MEKLYSAEQTAETVGCSVRKIQLLAEELIAAGHAQRVGKMLVFDETAFLYVITRPDRRRKEFRNTKSEKPR